MRIPSGDLAPVRRRGGRPAWLPALVGLLLVAAVAGGALLLRRQDAGTGRAASRASCAAPRPLAAAPALSTVPAPRTVALRLLNGSGRNHLAHLVGGQLAARGFRVTAVGTAPRALAGPARVYFGPAARPAAVLAGAQVLGAVLVPEPAAGPALDVVLGSGFVRLRTPAETARYLRTLPQPSAPASSGPACR